MTRLLRSVLLLATTALIAAACSGGGGVRRDAEGTIVEPGQESVFDIRAGDCLDPALDMGEAIENIEAVPCSEPHTHEVYADITYEENDVYPGAAELEQFADVACLDAFPDYVGIDYFDSGLFFTYLYPTLDGWNDSNDRQIICVAALPGALVAESFRDSGGEFDIVIPPPIDGETVDPDPAETGSPS